MVNLVNFLNPVNPRGSRSLMQWISVVAFFVVLGLSTFAYIQTLSLNKSIQDVAEQTTVANAQLTKFQEQQLDSIIVAQQTIDRIKASGVLWSGVITHLLAVTPLDVFYRSYSASEDGKMNVSVITDTYDSSAHLISVLDQDPQFGNVFVASVSRGTSESGAEAVTFGVTFNVR